MVKIFVLGFPKSGTTTLQQAFGRAGLRSAHWRVGDQYCGELIYEDFRAGRNPLERMSDHDCITQPDVCRPNLHRDGGAAGPNYWPQLDFDVISAIQAHNPDIRFILNRREVPDIIRSITRWADLRERLTVSDIIGLPPGKGGADEDLRAWIEGHYRACEHHFADQPERLLDFNITDPDAHAKVQAFVGVELPWWGIANPNDPLTKAKALDADDKRELAQEAMPALEQLGWIASRKAKRPVDANLRLIPSYSYPAISFVAERVRPEMRVFDFGSGFSTLWWAEHASVVTSVENHRERAEEMSRRLPDNAHVTYVPFERGGPYCRSAVTTVGGPYHVIVIDGRDRVNCARHCLQALRDDGVIVWDDTERAKYARGCDYLRDHGFRRLPFHGFAPRMARLKETSVFYRPDNCFDI
jgi:predicted O-methyltransferase YrrM